MFSTWSLFFLPLFLPPVHTRIHAATISLPLFILRYHSIPLIRYTTLSYHSILFSIVLVLSSCLFLLSIFHPNIHLLLFHHFCFLFFLFCSSVFIPLSSCLNSCLRHSMYHISACILFTNNSIQPTHILKHIFFSSFYTIRSLKSQ